MITENLDTFLTDFGVPVTCGSVTGTGILDMPDQTIGDGLAISTEYSIRVKASDFEAVAKRNVAITVDGVAYKVREYNRVDDGKFARIILTKL